MTQIKAWFLGLKTPLKIFVSGVALIIVAALTQAVLGLYLSPCKFLKTGLLSQTPFRLGIDTGRSGLLNILPVGQSLPMAGSTLRPPPRWTT